MDDLLYGIVYNNEDGLCALSFIDVSEILRRLIYSRVANPDDSNYHLTYHPRVQNSRKVMDLLFCLQARRIYIEIQKASSIKHKKGIDTKIFGGDFDGVTISPVDGVLSKLYYSANVDANSIGLVILHGGDRDQCNSARSSILSTIRGLDRPINFCEKVFVLTIWELVGMIRDQNLPNNIEGLIANLMKNGRLHLGEN
ncbi:hypothetical protein [Chitinilyticum aquatile]|uniref:hypothetical protein n=1 Tax=Chitinilyticum aquatile TaxID=362520 RepID=UPI0012DDE175|nr:hypothetical protein [Chitinilyticum aquatile]